MIEIGLSVFIFCLPSQAADWRQFQCDSAKTGINLSEKLPVVVGKYSIDFQSFGGDTVFNLASAVVVGDTIYMGTAEGAVVAKSRETGAESWRKQVGGPVTNAPAYLDSLLVVVTQTGIIKCLDTSDGGRELWRYYLGTSVIASPSVAMLGDGARVFVGGLDGSVSCLGITDGSLIWRMATAGPIHGSPAQSEDGTRVYIASDDMSLYALNSKTGAILWKSNPQSIQIGRVRASVAVRGNRLYVASLNHGLFCVADQNYSPMLQWRVDFTGSHTGSPAVIPPYAGVSRNTVFVANDAGQVFAIGDGGSAGIEDWHRDVSPSNRIAGSLAYADGQVFVCSEDRKLHILDSRSGLEKTSFSVTEALDSSPAIAHGDVIVADASGRLYAFGNPLNPPRNLSAMVDDNQRVILSWSPEYAKPLGITPVSGYTIYRSLRPDGEYAPIGYIEGQQFIRDDRGIIIAVLTTSIYTDSGITSSGFYYYSVTAMNEETGAPPLEESTYSDCAGAEVIMPPAPPRITDLTAIAGDGNITLQWNTVAGGARVLYVAIYVREGTTGPFVFAKTIWGGDSFQDIKVENRVSYTYQVRAMDANGVFGPESEVTATPYTIGWPMFQRDALHEAYDPGLSVPPPLAERWRIKLSARADGQGFSGYQGGIIVGGTLFVTSVGGDVRAYVAKTGTLIWSRSGCVEAISSPAYFNGRLYVTHGGGLTVFMADSGNIAWSEPVYWVGYGQESSPIIYKGILYIGMIYQNQFQIVAVDIDPSSYRYKMVLWAQPFGYTFVKASPGASRGLIYMVDGGGNVKGMNYLTGAVVWTQWLGSYVTTTESINISVYPPVVLIAHGNGSVYAFDSATGVPRWNKFVGSCFTSPAVAGVTVFIASHRQNTVYALNSSNGNTFWVATTYTVTGNVYQGGPIVADGRLHVYSTNGQLFTINASNGSVLESLNLENVTLFTAHLSGGEGQLYVPTLDGRLIALTPVTPAPLGLTASAGIGAIRIGWIAAAPNAYAIAGYSIFRSTASGVTGAVIGNVSGGEATVYADSTSLPGVLYYYRVAATDERGIQGRTSGYAYGRAWFQPNINALISAPVTGSVGCLNPVFTITVSGTASSGNFDHFTLQADAGSGFEPVNTSSTTVVNGPLGVVTFSQGGSATLLLTVFDASGVQGSATAIVDISAKNLAAEVTWPSDQVIIPYSCDVQPMTLTLTGVAFGDRFTGYRLELARLSSSLTVLSASVYSDPVYTNGRLGMVTLPDCDNFVIRMIISDSCGRTRTVAVTLELQSPASFLASITTFSTRGRLPGEHRRPMDVAVDKEDFVWVVDTMNKRVQKYTATGRFLFEFGEQDAGLTDGIIFRDPVAAAFDSANRLLVLDRLSGLVMRFDDSGRAMGVFGGTGSGPGVFNHPLGLGVDGWDRIWVADTLNNRIQVFDSQGRLESISGVRGDGIGEFQHPSGVQPHTGPMSGGMIIVADTGNDRVQLIGESRSFLMAFGGPGTAPGEFNGPYETVMGSDNSIFTSDTGNNRIEWRIPGGNMLILLPPASVTLFNMPHGLTLDRESSMLYVADTGNNRIVAIKVRNAADTIPPRALITGPAGGSVVSGDAEVTGIAADAYFMRYRLEYGAGSAPEDYTLVTESTEPIWNGVLGKWDTGSLQPGSYRLRLNVEDKAGNKAVAEATVEVREPAPLIVTAKVEPPAFDPDINGTVLFYQTSVPAGVRIVIMRHGSGRRVWAADIEESDGNGWTPEVRTVTWDGKDETGQLVEPGKYSVVLVARTGEKTETRQLSLVALSSPAALARSLGGASANGNPVAGASHLNTASAGGVMVGSGGEASPGAGSNPETGSELNRSTHDNGMGNGKNPKDFDRGSNPGHGNK